MYNFDGEKKKSKVIGLQLAPMIDIFVLIIVFLLKGTILESTAIEKPEGLQLAKSVSREESEVAPQVVISSTKVSFKMVNEERPASAFESEDFDVRDPLIQAFKDYIQKNKKIEGAQNINVISDQAMSYKVVYNVVRLLRVSGFQSMLFVAEGEGQ
ncbi:MAG: ExbD/TolR family protein [Bdellovibrionales bacterium]